ncbi:ATP-binding protein [Neorhizobium petrolearium]|uniref:ATP-binding protein n=1 Tax=Neorhizobium petrolearium TaxID=515361 RepID=A0ABY8MAY6_9HYPH|nr:ATP-binding protein [Neorhizobium petrolearium]MCC2610827.1 ATP-binding protein [Neorhizobium petrolearium]WGI70944.1 ATP-binding protein [Neorhizobium petrolearium]
MEKVAMITQFHTTKFETPVARHAVSMLGRLERKTLIDTLLVTYPVFDDITAFIEKLHYPVAGGSHGTRMVAGLMGKTRAGKTDIIKHYCNRWPPFHSDDGVVHPVIYLPVTGENTPQSLAEMIYEATGPGTAPKIKVASLMRNAVARIVRARTQLVIIDDAQFFFHERSKNHRRDFFSFLKQLADTEVLNVLLVGEEDIYGYIQANAPLAGRGGFPKMILAPFGENAFDQFRLLLREVDLRLPFAESSGLASKSIARDLFDFTSGAIGQVFNVVRPAAWQALNDDAPRILPHHLYEQAAIRQRPGDTREYFKMEG